MDTLRDYKRTAKEVVNNYDIEGLPIADKMSLISMLGLTGACSLITECRSPGEEFTADTWFAQDNPVYHDFYCTSLRNSWVLCCCLVWESKSRLDSLWSSKEFQEAYRKWPKKPDTTAFYIAGWSAVEVIHLLLWKFADIVGLALRIQFTTLVEPNIAEEVGPDDVEDYEDNITLGQNLSLEAANWFRVLRESIKGHLPNSDWPDCFIRREYNRLGAQLEYETKQYKATQQEETETKQKEKKTKPKKRGRNKDHKVRTRNKKIAEYRVLNPKLTWKKIGFKFDVSADTARKACNNPDN